MSGLSNPVEAGEEDYQQVDSATSLLDAKTTIAGERSRDRVRELRELSNELMTEAIKWEEDVKEAQDAFETLSIADRYKKKSIEQGKEHQEEWNEHMDCLIAILHKFKSAQPKQLGTEQVKKSMEGLRTKVLGSDEVQLAIAKKSAEMFDLAVKAHDYSQTFIEAAIDYVEENREWLKKYQSGSMKRVGIVSCACKYAESALKYLTKKEAPHKELNRAKDLLHLLYEL